MRIGMSLSSTSSLPARDAAEHLLARVRAARAAGLDTLTFGDSHARSPERYFQNTPTLGRVLAEWDPERAAGCLFLVPLWNPVLIAEHVGTLAAFHPGRFVVQTGLGGRGEARRLGVRVGHRGDALDEGIAVVRALLAGDTVTSEYFGIDGVRLGLVPPDGVDWWIGTMSPTGLDRAGALGAAWYASHGATSETLPPMLERYRSACAQAGTTPVVAVRRDAVILPDGDLARRRAADALAVGYRGGMDASGLLAGAVDDVVAALEQLADLGVDEIVVRTMGLDPATDLATIAALGEVRERLS